MTLEEQMVGKLRQIKKWAFEFGEGDGRATVHGQVQTRICMLCSKDLGMAID